MKKSVFVMAGILAAMFAAAAYAGSLDATTAPGSTNNYKVDDIYNRLNNGTTGAQGTFTGPPSGAIGGTGHTLNEVMGKAPAKDDTNGATPADVKPGKTFWGLNKAAGQWGPRTGGPRFTDNGNGTVKDNLTGLIWLKNANCWGAIAWATALTNANGLASGSCGLTDSSTAGQWRLPNIVELQSLIDFAYSNPALTSGHPFSNVQADTYWSATTYAVSTTYAWVVNLYDGAVGYGNKTVTYYVWPVR